MMPSPAYDLGRPGGAIIIGGDMPVTCPGLGCG